MCKPVFLLHTTCYLRQGSDLFFSDIAVVDMSDVFRQPSLFYHLGVRESFDMANNVILYHDTDPDTAQSLKVCARAYSFTPPPLEASVRVCYTAAPPSREIGRAHV